jgi:hypothetical protein
LKCKFRSAGILFKIETSIYRQENRRKIMDVIYIDKCWYEIPGTKKVPVWYTGKYWRITGF